MGRYIVKFELRQPIDVVSMLMDDYIYHNRFIRGDWNGEMVYFMKDNHGKERYFQWHYTDGVIYMEAWLKGSFGKERDLKGMGASGREFRQSIENLIRRLKTQSPESLAGGHIGSDPLHHDSSAGKNHDTWRADTGWQQNTAEQRMGRKALPEGQQSLMFAALALIFSVIFPVLGIVFAVIALKKRKQCAYPQVVKPVVAIAIVIICIGFFSKVMFSMISMFYLF